jgi:hypothetical protein
MAGQKAKGGKKQRKFGRWNRSQSMKSYVAENRAEVNKQRRIKRHERRMAR